MRVHCIALSKKWRNTVIKKKKSYLCVSNPFCINCVCVQTELLFTEVYGEKFLPKKDI